MIFKASRYANSIPKITETSNWLINNVFNKGILLTNKEDALFIGTNQTSMGPFHIAIEENDLILIKEFIGNNELIKLGNSNNLISFDLDPSKMYSCNIISNKSNYNANHIELLSGFLKSCNKSNGFQSENYILIDEEFHNNNHDPLSIFSSNDSIIKFLKYYIGRGQGLTPSGDDFLIGFLAVFADENILNELLYKIITKELTTTVSYYFYKYAINRYFDYNIVKLLEAMQNHNINSSIRYMKEISNYGHTSGIDTLLGIYFAIFCKSKIRSI